MHDIIFITIFILAIIISITIPFVLYRILSKEHF